MRRLFRTIDRAVAAPDRGKDNCHPQDERQDQTECACKAGYRPGARDAKCLENLVLDSWLLPTLGRPWREGVCAAEGGS